MSTMHRTTETEKGRHMRRLVPTRHAAQGDDGVALLAVIMLIMVLGMLSILVMGVMVAQVRPTMFGTKNSKTVFAAEAGIDATLSQVRTALGAPDALTGAVMGDSRKLPCTVQGPVGGTGSTLSYQVSITYFDDDPKLRDASWRSANKFVCTPGAGVASAPSFAVITAEGLDAGVAGFATDAGDRTIETIYQFKIDNNNIEGGTIYSAGAGYCLQANGQTVGSTISYVPATGCRIDDPRRLWSWGKDYAIHLAVTDLVGSPVGKLCITGRPSSGSVDATLQVCNGATNQMFSWQGGAKWKVQNAGNTDYSPFCMSAGEVLTDLTNKPLKIGWCGDDNTLSTSFDPDPRVGAGAAGYTTSQIVNFLEFGRCMDVTDGTVGSAQMIVYPCKQDPSGGSKLEWNHKWFYNEPAGTVGSSATQPIFVRKNNSTATADKYCLTTPSKTASPAYATLTVCDGRADQGFTRNADTGVYRTSWTFVDRWSRCISLGPKWTKAGTTVSWSTLVAVDCNGGPEQKWNAPPVQQDAKLDDYQELKN